MLTQCQNIVNNQVRSHPEKGFQQAVNCSILPVSLVTTTFRTMKVCEFI